MRRPAARSRWPLPPRSVRPGPRHGQGARTAAAGAVAALLLAAAHAPAAAQTDIPRGGARYDRLTDSTAWFFGFTDKVVFHGAGAAPTCAARATVILADLSYDVREPAKANALLAQAAASPPLFRLLIDSAGALTRVALPGRLILGGWNGYPAALWRYPVPDSLLARFRAASLLEGADDRNHRFRWESGKLRGAPPVCAAAGAPSVTTDALAP